MIFAWLKALPIAGKVAVGAIVALLVLGVILAIVSSFERQQEVGAELERGKANEEIIHDVEAVKKAEEQRGLNPELRRDDCVRWSRTPENC